MKHLKTYKSHSKYLNISDDVRDMLLELEDEGYETKVDDDMNYRILISINKKSSPIINSRKDFELINGVISRIKNYMKDYYPDWSLRIDDLSDMGITEIFDKDRDIFQQKRFSKDRDIIKIFNQAPIKIRYEKR